MDRVLVTGAGGFLGCYVVQRLVDKGVRVGAMMRPGSSSVRLTRLKDHPRVELLEADIASSGSLGRVFDDFEPDGVIHLAAAGVWGSPPIAEMIRVNTAGMASLLEQPRLKAKRLVAAGSMFEYGENDGVIDEAASCHPRDNYGFSKLKASELLFLRDDIDWVLLRTFGLFGPWERAGRLVPSLVTGLNAGRRIPLSDGEQVRDFVYVEDAADAFVRALLAEGVSHEVINIGSGLALSVKDLALRAAACAGPDETRAERESLLDFGAIPRKGPEAPTLVAQVGKAREFLGWEAANTIDAGLRRCFEWYASEQPRNPWDEKSPTRAPFSLVMPCYNEERSLPESIPPLAAILQKQGVDCELVLVNNGSTDGTAAVIDSFIAQGLPVVRVDVARNEGYGHGILTGLKAARGRYIGFMCADGQIAPEDVARFLWAVDRVGANTLVKVRRVSRGDGIFRWIQSRFFNLICLVLFRTMTTDINATPKMMERRLWERMDLESKDWFIDAEVTFKAKGLGLNFVEVPVVFMPRQSGRSWVNLGTTFEFARHIVRVLFKKGERDG